MPTHRRPIHSADRLPRALAGSATHIRRRRACALALAGALAGSLALAASASADWLTPESGGSPNADEIDSLYKLILVIAAIVFVAVEGALIWALVKFRARKGAVAAQIHGNTRLEIGWTVGAAAILIFLVVFTFMKLPAIKNPPPSDANGLQTASAEAIYASTDQPTPPGGETLNITVDGQQYVWRYQYPGKDDVFAYEEMVVPAHTTVTLDISADDVAHSWWIPKLGGKMDALPGYVNKTWFKAKPGVYRGQCAELCGRNHANMLARVRVLPPEEYVKWYETQRDSIKAAREAQATKRRKYGTPTGSDEQEALGGTSEAGPGTVSGQGEESS